MAKGFANWTPEERAAAVAKAAETRAAKKAAATPAPAAEPDEPDLGAAARAARRRRLTMDLPADVAALISDEELAKIEAEEQQKALDARRKQALADVRALASAEAKIEHGLIPADVLRTEAEQAEMNEPVTFRVNLPRGGGALGFRVNGFLYRHGETYTRPRHVFNSLLSMHYKAHFDEIRFRTLDQGERGNSAVDIITRNPPTFEVTNG